MAQVLHSNGRLVGMAPFLAPNSANQLGRQRRPEPRHQQRRRPHGAPQALLGQLLQRLSGGGGARQAQAAAQRAAVARLLSSIEGTQRGAATSPEAAAQIVAAVEELAQLGAGQETTGAQLSATWRLLWTTEKETLFILKRAALFGTQAGEVFQVIDVEEGTLQNVITFPPEGSFTVDSSASVAGPQRMDFAFQGGALRTPRGRLPLPPFGRGWFDTVYMDGSIRVARDSRGDTLVVARDGPPRQFD